MLKVYDPITFVMEFWDQMKAPIFLITPVKFYLQQMLSVKVINENIA